MIRRFRMVGLLLALGPIALLGACSSSGEALSEDGGGGEVDVWVAPTRYGAPWVVMGTAESEAAFWSLVDADDDLAGLGPARPAVRHRAFFLVDDDEDPAAP